MRILIATASISIAATCSSAHAGWWGPSNYDECILESMKGVTSDVAARNIVAACRRKFPEADTSCTLRALADDERKNVKVSGKVYRGLFNGSVYNGNSNVTVKEIDIELAHDGTPATYASSVYVAPQSTHTLLVGTIEGTYDKGSFRLVEVRGCKE